VLEIWTICDSEKAISYRIVSMKSAFEIADCIDKWMVSDDFDIYYLRACSFVEKDNFPDAIKDATTAIEKKKTKLNLEFDDAYYIRGLAHMNSK
jgi:tetratricopeptide (TPR) repeat protein